MDNDQEKRTTGQSFAYAKKRAPHQESNSRKARFTPDDTVTSLSSRKLSKSEISVLSKGFSFIPTRNKIDLAKLQSDLAEWERHMRLRE